MCMRSATRSVLWLRDRHEHLRCGSDRPPPLTKLDYEVRSRLHAACVTGMGRQGLRSSPIARPQANGPFHGSLYARHTRGGRGQSVRNDGQSLAPISTGAAISGTSRVLLRCSALRGDEFGVRVKITFLRYGSCVTIESWSSGDSPEVRTV